MKLADKTTAYLEYAVQVAVLKKDANKKAIASKIFITLASKEDSEEITGIS